MNRSALKSGFSLTEVLMAAGILVVGFLLIAGTFPVGIKLTAVATERTIGVVAAEEAMAKIHLYGINRNAPRYYDSANWTRIVHVPYDGITLYQYLTAPTRSIFISPTALSQLSLVYPGFSANPLALDRYFQYESLYPSTAFFDYSVPATPAIRTDAKDPQRYFWSALCRRLDSTSSEIQFTIFTCRMAGENAQYPRFVPLNRATGIVNASDTPWTYSNYPTPVPVKVTGLAGAELRHQDAAGIKSGSYYYSTITWIKDSWTTDDVTRLGGYIVKGAMLLDDNNGRLMRVQEVRRPDSTNPLGEIILMRAPDTDGNPITIDATDMEGLLMFSQGDYAQGFTQRIVWVIPPARAVRAAAGELPTSMPPTVAGRSPCVGVYQGQL